MCAVTGRYSSRAGPLARRDMAGRSLGAVTSWRAAFVVPGVVSLERPFAEIRRRKDLDLSSAALRVGIHPRYLRQLERGTRALPMVLAERMAEAYETTVADLTRPCQSRQDEQRAAGGWERRPPRGGGSYLSRAVDDGQGNE